MTYFDGFVAPVPESNRDAYRKHSAEFAALLADFGIERQVEAWQDDVPEGKVTDFRKAVNAEDGEAIVFSWFEYPSKQVRQSAHEKIGNDPRMKTLGESMPFDGKRMIISGFEAIVEQGEPGGAYADGFVVPVPNANREAYRQLAEKAAGIFREYGATRVVEAWGDEVLEGKVTDFRRAVKQEQDENVVFSFIEWPDKATRDEAWKKIMEDERMKPEGDMPFAGQRMFWGGFEKILDTAKSPAAAEA